VTGSGAMIRYHDVTYTTSQYDNQHRTEHHQTLTTYIHDIISTQWGNSVSKSRRVRGLEQSPKWGTGENGPVAKYWHTFGNFAIFYYNKQALHSPSDPSS